MYFLNRTEVYVPWTTVTCSSLLSWGKEYSTCTTITCSSLLLEKDFHVPSVLNSIMSEVLISQISLNNLQQKIIEFFKQWGQHTLLFKLHKQIRALNVHEAINTQKHLHVHTRQQRDLCMVLLYRRQDISTVLSCGVKVLLISGWQIVPRAYKEKRACNSPSIQHASKNQSHRQDILSATCNNLLIEIYFS